MVSPLKHGFRTGVSSFRHHPRSSCRSMFQPRVRPRDPSLSLSGSLSLSKHHGYPCLPCPRSACLRAPHRQAQAGVPTAQVEDTNPKRTISIESHPCRPDLEDEATSCRKIFRQPIGNGSIAIAIARRRKHGALSPSYHAWGNVAAIMLLDIVISIVPPAQARAVFF